MIHLDDFTAARSLLIELLHVDGDKPFRLQKKLSDEERTAMAIATAGFVLIYLLCFSCDFKMFNSNKIFGDMVDNMRALIDEVCKHEQAQETDHERKH